MHDCANWSNGGGSAASSPQRVAYSAWLWVHGGYCGFRRPRQSRPLFMQPLLSRLRVGQTILGRRATLYSFGYTLQGKCCGQVFINFQEQPALWMRSTQPVGPLHSPMSTSLILRPPFLMRFKYLFHAGVRLFPAHRFPDQRLALMLRHHQTPTRPKVQVALE